MKPLTQKQRDALQYGQIIRILRGCVGQLNYLKAYHGIDSYLAAKAIAAISALELVLKTNYEQNTKARSKVPPSP